MFRVHVCCVLFAVLFGFLCHVGVFALAYLFLPPDSPLSPDAAAHRAASGVDPSHSYFRPECVPLVVLCWIPQNFASFRHSEVHDFHVRVV